MKIERFSGDLVFCKPCHGQGKRLVGRSSWQYRLCPACDGTGKVSHPCGWRPHDPCRTNVLDEMLAALDGKPGVEAFDVTAITQEMVDAMLEDS